MIHGYVAPSSPPLAIALPGAGADAELMRAVFGPAAHDAGFTLHAIEPDPQGVRESYLRALDTASSLTNQLMVCGMSFGAHVGAHWASHNPDRCLGLLACMPAWIGDPQNAPAACNARDTAHALRQVGLLPLLDAMRIEAPPWVAHQLIRSWTAQWPYLPNAFEEISNTSLPTRDELGALTIPVVVGAVSEDPYHPISVAQQWHQVLPYAQLETVALSSMATNPALLGHRTWNAWSQLSTSAP